MYHIDMPEVIHMNVIHHNRMVCRTKQETTSVAMMVVEIHVEADIVVIGTIMMTGITVIYTRPRHEEQITMNITQVNAESPSG